jgi:hypothetical protein
VFLLGLLAPATAASLALPTSEAASAWQAAATMAGLTVNDARDPMQVELRRVSEVWLLVAHAPDGREREVEVRAPSNAAAREDLALVAASLLADLARVPAVAASPRPTAPVETPRGRPGVASAVDGVDATPGPQKVSVRLDPPATVAGGSSLPRLAPLAEGGGPERRRGPDSALVPVPGVTPSASALDPAIAASPDEAVAPGAASAAAPAPTPAPALEVRGVPTVDPPPPRARSDEARAEQPGTEPGSGTTSARNDPPTLSATASAGATWSPSLGVAPDARLGLRLDRGWLRAGVDAGWSGARPTPLEDGPSCWEIGGDLRGGIRLPGPASVLVSAGLWRRSFGRDGALWTVLWMPVVGAAAEVDLRLGERLWLVPELAGRVDLYETHVRDQGEIVLVPSPWAISAGVGLRSTFFP